MTTGQWHEERGWRGGGPRNPPHHYMEIDIQSENQYRKTTMTVGTSNQGMSQELAPRHPQGYAGYCHWADWFVCQPLFQQGSPICGAKTRITHYPQVKKAIISITSNSLYIYTVLAFHIISCMAFFKCTDALKAVIVPLHSEIGLLCVDDSFGECALPSLHNPTLSPTITLQIKEWSYRLEPFKQFLTVLTQTLHFNSISNLCIFTFKHFSSSIQVSLLNTNNTLTYQDHSQTDNYWATYL